MAPLAAARPPRLGNCVRWWWLPPPSWDRFIGQHLIVPQTILVRAYLERIFAGPSDAGLPVFHIVLDAGEQILPQRIQDSGEAQAWRLAHLADYQAALSWMMPTADLVADTGCQTPAQAARQIADALPGL